MTGVNEDFLGARGKGERMWESERWKSRRFGVLGPGKGKERGCLGDWGMLNNGGGIPPDAQRASAPSVLCSTVLLRRGACWARLGATLYCAMLQWAVSPYRRPLSHDGRHCTHRYRRRYWQRYRYRYRYRFRRSLPDPGPGLTSPKL